MSSKLIEDELNQLHGKSVEVVKPYFGNQSSAFIGILTSGINDMCSVWFHFVSPGEAMMFTAEDVTRIDVRGNMKSVIRLKGPSDYMVDYKYNNT